MITIKDNVIAKLKSFLLGYDNAIFAFLFGSYAEGSVTRDSDLDIAIFSTAGRIYICGMN